MFLDTRDRDEKNLSDRTITRFKYIFLVGTGRHQPKTDIIRLEHLAKTAFAENTIGVDCGGRLKL